MLCKTLLASGILSHCEDDDIVQPGMKILDPLNRLVAGSSPAGATIHDKAHIFMWAFSFLASGNFNLGEYRAPDVLRFPVG